MVNLFRRLFFRSRSAPTPHALPSTAVSHLELLRALGCDE